MSIKPLLTVLLITYNHKEYIEKSINSVLDQKTDFNFVIKIIDDCSSDGTSKIVKKYAKQYPEKIQHILRKKNCGPVDNLYEGLKSIDTIYFAELEGDDYWCDENKLQIAVDILEKNKDCVMFAHNTKILKNGEYFQNVIDRNNGFYAYCDTKFKLEIDRPPVLLHFSSRVYKNIFDFTKINKDIAAFDLGIYYLYLDKGSCYYHDKVMSVYNTNEHSFYYPKPDIEKENMIYLLLQKLSKQFYYRYNEMFVRLLGNEKLFKNIEEIYGIEEAWELYGGIKIILEKTFPELSRSDLIYFKLKNLINKVRYKLKIRTRLLKLICIIKNLINKVRYKLKIRTRLLKLIGITNQIDTDILIFDDIFPHPFSAFRYTEYTEYLKYFDKIKIICNGLSLFYCKDNKNIKYLINEYLDKFPLFKSKLSAYKPTTFYKAKLIYVNFLGSVVHYDLGYSFKVPFIVNLYPGGFLQVNNKEIDNYLKKYLCSTYCKKVIVTQDYVYDYLVTNKLCPKEKIEFIFGGVVSLELLDIKVSNKERYGFQKNTLDVCFVAQKYSEYGADKGYDTFIKSAGILAQKYDNVKFHVVGSFDKNVIDVSTIRERIEFYGTQQTNWFKDFYKNKDIIISPNIPFILGSGCFDGFPTGCVVEAGINEVAMFVTDELDMNKNRFIDDKEIVIIKPSENSIVEKVDFYLKNPNKLKSISEAGVLKIKDLYSYEKQITSRINIIQNELDKIRNN